MKIGKQDLIDKLAEKTGLSKRDATAAVNGYMDIIEEAMVAGDKITVPGFGSFEVQSVKARMGRNVRTGEQLSIPAHKRVKFKPGKTLAEKVANT